MKSSAWIWQILLAKTDKAGCYGLVLFLLHLTLSPTIDESLVNPAQREYPTHTVYCPIACCLVPRTNRCTMIIHNHAMKYTRASFFQIFTQIFISIPL